MNQKTTSLSIYTRDALTDQGDTLTMKKDSLKPYCQGHLDRYCGFYCIINSIHYLRGPLSGCKATELFYDCMRSLNQTIDVVERIYEGTLFEELGELLKQILATYQLRYRQPFEDEKNVSLDHYWQTLQRFISTHNGIALIGLDGFYSHWTLVSSVSSRSLTLFDSNGMKRINRSHCTTGIDSSSQRHLISPAYVYFIWPAESEEVNHV